MEKTKNIPKIRFKGYKDEWGKDKLSDLCDVRDGTHDSPKYFDYGYYFITSKNVKNGSINFDDVKFISKDDYDAINKRSKVHVGDILFGVIGTIGNIALVKDEPNYAIKNVALIKDIDKIYNFYNYYYLQSQNVEKQLDFGLDGGTQKFLSLKSIRGLSINYPNKEEQKQIGSLFKNLDEKLEIEREKHEKLVNFKKAMLENVFPKEGEKRPKIRFGGYNDDWEKTQLNDIGKKYTSLTGKTKEDFGHGEGRYITFTNILANPVALLEGVEKIEVDKRQTDVKNGDLFFNISSETYEEVGMSSVWTYDKENYYLNSFCMGFRPSIELDSYFITYLLRSQAVRKQIMKLAQGISRINISQNKMLDIYLSIPSINEQKLIGSFFKNLDEKIQVSEEKITKIENFKKAMMDRLFV